LELKRNSEQGHGILGILREEAIEREEETMGWEVIITQSREEGKLM
jgi:hypothetical protein